MQKRSRTIWILGSAIGVAVSIGGAVALRHLGPGSAAPPAHVVVRRVVSGQHVRTDDRQDVIYAGIRAPYSGEPLFEEAKRRNEQLVEGKPVQLQYDKRLRDSENRLLAYVQVDGMLVNETMVREGLAYVQLAHGEKSSGQQLMAAQAEARARKLGLWALKPPAGESSYVCDNRRAVFHRPSCALVAEIKAKYVTNAKTRDEALDKGLAPCRRCLP